MLTVGASMGEGVLDGLLTSTGTARRFVGESAQVENGMAYGGKSIGPILIHLFTILRQNFPYPADEGVCCHRGL